MKVLLLLPLLAATTPVLSLHQCEPFSQAKHDDLTMSFVETERTPSGVNFTFFVEKEGVDSANEWAMANMGPLYQEVQALPIKAHAYNGKKLVDCTISTPGWEDWRFYAKADCPVDVDDPERLTLFLEEDAIILDLCTDPPKPSRSSPSLAVCVRSFSATVFGTEDIAVTPEHVTRWLDHHVKLGIDRFYLYERNKGELSAFLEPYMSANPSARESVEITYVPRLSQQNKTFDKLETKSYVFDQIMGMQSCFSKARTQNFDYVFHIDYDEYIHSQEETSIHEAVHRDMASCPVPNGLSVVRCNIPNTTFDVPVAPSDAKCFPNDSNVKTAFNATFMGGNVFHSIHVVQPRCNSSSVLIHHLPDAYANRSSSPTYFRNLWGLDDKYCKGSKPGRSKGSRYKVPGRRKGKGRPTGGKFRGKGNNFFNRGKGKGGYYGKGSYYGKGRYKNGKGKGGRYNGRGNTGRYKGKGGAGNGRYKGTSKSNKGRYKGSKAGRTTSYRGNIRRGGKGSSYSGPPGKKGKKTTFIGNFFHRFKGKGGGRGKRRTSVIGEFEGDQGYWGPR